jgi:hypothetical protein
MLLRCGFVFQAMLLPTHFYALRCHKQPANASASSIEKAWNLAWAEDVLGIDINEMSTIVELGGGHGQVRLKL